MTKKLVLLAVLLFVALPAWSAQYLVALAGYTGGTTGKLDMIYVGGSTGKYSALADGDVCWVYDPSTKVFVPYYFYVAGAPQSESSPTIIVPDWQSAGVAYSGNGAWLRGLLDSATISGTIGADLINTAYPWADNEVSDTLTIGASSTVANGALDTDLQTWAGVTSSANGRSLVSAADYAAMKVLLGLTVGSDVQAYDADLVDLADGSLTGSKIGDGIDDDYVSFDDTDSLWTATKIGPALEELNDSINAGAPNGTGAKVHWSQLLGVPAGFADGTDDGGSPALDDLSDVAITSAERGDVLFRGASGWVNLHHGTSGQYLKTGGDGADVSWDTPAGSGDMLAATYTDLVALEAVHNSGLLTRTGAQTFDVRSIAVSGAGLDVTNGDGISGNPTIALDIAPSSGSATLEEADDGLQVKYDSTYFSEGANGLTLATLSSFRSAIGIGTEDSPSFFGLTVGTGGITMTQSYSSAGGWMGYEDGDNGTNAFTWLVPAAITNNRTFQMIDTDPSAGQVMAWTLSDSTITQSWVTPILETTIDASSELAAIMDDETGTAGSLVFSNSPTFDDDITLHSAGVKLTGDGDGAITFLGLGNGYDEDLTLNLDDTENTAKVSSSTGVNTVDFSALNLATTGTITGKVPVVTIDSARAITSAEAQGSLIFITAAGTYTLPAAATAGYGSTVCIYVRDASETVVIEVDNADKIRLYATALDAGDTIDSPGAAGNFVCLMAVTDADGSGTDGWITLGYSGTWTDGGAS